MAVKSRKIKESGLGTLLAKGLAMAVVIVAAIWALESKRIFVEDSANNHVEWKWDWYYRLKENDIPIDVLFVGN